MLDKRSNLLNPLPRKKLRIWKRLGLAISACLLPSSCAATAPRPGKIAEFGPQCKYLCPTGTIEEA